MVRVIVRFEGLGSRVRVRGGVEGLGFSVKVRVKESGRVRG